MYSSSVQFIEIDVLLLELMMLGDLGTLSKKAKKGPKALGDDKWTCATGQMTKQAQGHHPIWSTLELLGGEFYHSRLGQHKHLAGIYHSALWSVGK